MIYIDEELEEDIILIKKVKIPIFSKNKSNDREYIIINKDNNNINSLFDENENNMIFNLNNFVNDILKSYNYKLENIWIQFKKDFPRCIFCINNVKINDITSFIKISKENNFLEKHTLFNILIMLCCQSTLSFPMEKIINYYNLGENDMYLADFSSKNQNHMYVNITIDPSNKENVSINIKKRLKIFKLKYKNDVFLGPKNMYYVDMQMNFQFNNINKLIDINKFHDIIDENSILTWKLNKIM